MPTGNLWMMKIAPENIRGTLVGRVSMFMFFGQFFSLIILQPVINNYGVGASLIFVSIVLFILFSLIFSVKVANCCLPELLE